MIIVEYNQDIFAYFREVYIFFKVLKSIKMKRIVRKVKEKKFGSIEKNSGEFIRKHVVPQCVFTKIKRTFYYVIAYDCIITKLFFMNEEKRHVNEEIDSSERGGGCTFNRNRL